MAKRQSRLELDTDDAFQKNEWRVQRLAWVLWSLVILAAGFGLLGPGWLSGREKTSADGSFTVGHERFLHYHNATQLVISIHTPPDAEGKWQVTVDRSLLDRMHIHRIDPEPDKQQIHEDGISYDFLGEPETARGRIIFHVEYERYGSANGKVTLVGSKPVALNQFVYP